MGKPKRTTHGLFIKGFRSDIPSGRIREFFLVLLHDLGIPIRKSNIKTVPQKDKTIAFLDLETAENTNKALKYLGSQKSRDRLNVDFSCIASDNDFCIRKINPKPEMESESRFNNLKSNASNNGLKAEGVHSTQCISTSTSARSVGVDPRCISIDTGTSVQSFAVKSTNKDVMFTKQKALDAATSVSGLEPIVRGKIYHYNEVLGSETRNVEFKEGKGNYKKNVLSEHVGMYVCSFANTLEGGTLLMGVTDRGLAQGVICSHLEEDQIRLRIDAAVKTIEPSILPNMYSVAFTPVLKNGTFSENLKVIEVSVHPSESHDELYEFRGEVYVRRDGSVQHFKPKDIKEWARKKAARDKALSQSIEQQLDQVTAQLQQIQTHMKRHPSKKSKSCCIL